MKTVQTPARRRRSPLGGYLLRRAGTSLILLVGVTVVTFLLACLAWSRFDPASSAFQLVETHAWLTLFSDRVATAQLGRGEVEGVHRDQ